MISGSVSLGRKCPLTQGVAAFLKWEPLLNPAFSGLERPPCWLLVALAGGLVGAGCAHHVLHSWGRSEPSPPSEWLKVEEERE